LRQSLVERYCEICGTLFSVQSRYVDRGHGRYCSLSCRDKAHDTRIKLNCLVCGKPILKPPCKVKTGRGKYCSKECKGIAQREYQLGENGPNWRGGIYPENQKYRHRKEYTEWREAVYIRDDYTCQDCGIRGDELHAHHVFAFADFPEHRLEPWNGVTLCVKCHNKCHSKTVAFCVI